MQIERVFEPELAPDVDAEIAGLLNESFGGGYGGRSFYQQRPSLRFLAWDDTRLIGHIAVCYRAVRLGDQELTAAGLIDVATRPDMQGKGVAKTLLRQVEDWARGTRADLLMLFGDHPVYAAMGYQSKHVTQRYVPMIGVRTHETQQEARPGPMILPLRPMAWDDSAVLDLVGFRF